MLLFNCNWAADGFIKYLPPSLHMSWLHPISLSYYFCHSHSTCNSYLLYIPPLLFLLLSSVPNLHIDSPFNSPPPNHSSPHWTRASHFPSLSVTQSVRLFLNWVNQHALPHLSLYIFFIPYYMVCFFLYCLFNWFNWLIPFMFMF